MKKKYSLQYFELQVDQVARRLATGWTARVRSREADGCDFSSLLRVQTGPGVHSASYKMSTASARARKSRYWGEMLLSPIHCCDETKPPYLLSGELCTAPLHSNRLFVYTVCCRRRGQCFSVLRTRHTDVVGDSTGRSYVTEQWYNVPLLRTRALVQCIMRRHYSITYKQLLLAMNCVGWMGNLLCGRPSYVIKHDLFNFLSRFR